MALLRVMLADDHKLLVEAFSKLLEPDYEVVGSVFDGRSLLETAPQLKPDVIIVDIGMPLMNGLEAGLRLKELIPTIKLIFLTMNEDPDLAMKAMRCGASGYLLKSSAGSELIRAIQMTTKGKSYVTPRIASAMQKAFINDPRPQKREKNADSTATRGCTTTGRGQVHEGSRQCIERDSTDCRVSQIPRHGRT